MDNGFRDKAIEFVKQAVNEDTAGNYEKALALYMHALDYFQTHLKYEKNPRSKEAIKVKVSTVPTGKTRTDAHRRATPSGSTINGSPKALVRISRRVSRGFLRAPYVAARSGP